MRTRVFTGIFMVTLTFLGMYLFKLQVIDHASLSDQARRNFIKPLVIPQPDREQDDPGAKE